ncbi:MAG: hypothetical protein E7543_07115 [Ruminococcaceae bacterium]|nr:hypothetical protein [Oscillospiraceae bacterium]
MKKALSVLLSVLVIFSMLGMAVSAADEDLIKIEFVIDDEVVQTLNVAPGVDYRELINEKYKVPTKEPADGKEYIFKYWVNDASKNTSSTSQLPIISADDYASGITSIRYVADFAEQDIKENQSFWAFVESIFERINMIFEYFAKVFEGVFDF